MVSSWVKMIARVGLNIAPMTTAIYIGGERKWIVNGTSSAKRSFPGGVIEKVCDYKFRGATLSIVDTTGHFSTLEVNDGDAGVYQAEKIGGVMVGLIWQPPEDSVYSVFGWVGLMLNKGLRWNFPEKIEESKSSWVKI